MFRLVLFFASIAFLLAGCAARGLGSSDYGCKGMPEGVRCLSTLEVYAATEHADAVRPSSASGETSTPISPDVSEPRASRTVSVQDTFSLLPKTDAPVPLRIPAQIMRIWFAPWEDASGDLHVGTITFTEIVPRRWAIGDAYTPEDSVLAPLQPDSAQ
jgi:conjugal transfer pilus assembly protein TraV